MIIIGLIVLVAALLIGLAGVLGNSGGTHVLNQDFPVLGYHVTGSTGTLFLSGIVIGAAAMLGLSLLLAGAYRVSRRNRAARRGLKQSRREAAAAKKERDDLLEQRGSAEVDPDQPPTHADRTVDEERGSGLSRLFGHRSAADRPGHPQHGE